MAWEGRSLKLGTSIGLALFPQHALDLNALLAAADMAMYRVKKTDGGIALADMPQRVAVPA